MNSNKFTNTTKFMRLLAPMSFVLGVCLNAVSCLRRPDCALGRDTYGGVDRPTAASRNRMVIPGQHVAESQQAPSYSYSNGRRIRPNAPGRKMGGRNNALTAEDMVRLKIRPIPSSVPQYDPSGPEVGHERVFRLGPGRTAQGPGQSRNTATGNSRQGGGLRRAGADILKGHDDLMRKAHELLSSTEVDPRYGFGLPTELELRLRALEDDKQATREELARAKALIAAQGKQIKKQEEDLKEALARPSQMGAHNQTLSNVFHIGTVHTEDPRLARIEEELNKLRDELAGRCDRTETKMRSYGEQLEAIEEKNAELMRRTGVTSQALKRFKDETRSGSLPEKLAAMQKAVGNVGQPLPRELAEQIDALRGDFIHLQKVVLNLQQKLQNRGATPEQARVRLPAITQVGRYDGQPSQRGRWSRHKQQATSPQSGLPQAPACGSEQTLATELEELKKGVALQLAELKEELDQLKARHVENIEASQIRGSLQELRWQFQQLEGSVAGVQDTASALAKIEEDMRQLSDRIAALEGLKLPGLIATSDEHEAKLGRIDTRIEQMGRRIEEMTAGLEKYKDSVEQLGTRVGTVEEKLPAFPHISRHVRGPGSAAQVQGVGMQEPQPSRPADRGAPFRH